MRARSLLLPGLALMVGVSATSSCGTSPQRAPSLVAVVTVNGQSLTPDQFDSFVHVKLGEFGRASLSDRVRSELLDEFVTREMALQDARTHGLVALAGPSAGPIADASLDEMTIDRLVQQYYREVVLKDVSVTDDELDAQLAMLRVNECGSDGYLVREICVPSRDQAEAARQKILSGKEPFGEVAKTISKTPTASRGGLSYYDSGVLPPALERAVRPLSPGEVSRVVETGYGYHIFQLQRRGSPAPGEKDRDRIAVDVLASKNERLVRANLQRLLEGASVSVNRELLPFHYEGRFASTK